MPVHLTSSPATALPAPDQPVGVRVMVTGGAGFIGSNLVDALLTDSRVARVRVLDNLSTGFIQNIEHHLGNPRFEFWEGDIRDFDTCARACDTMDLISHQAALGSVPRSIAAPLSTHGVNATGMLHILHAAKETKVRRVVYAASSSTYGDSKKLPKVEHEIGQPLSPYAVTKLVNELYANVYWRTFGLETIGLRYFNVFGPRQRPDGAYAAAIPLFINHLLNGTAPTINGNGSHSRDFTHISNAVQANLLALFHESPAVIGEVFNIAVGQQTTLLALFHLLRDALGVDIEPNFGPERQGDIPHSLANIEKAQKLLGYKPATGVPEGLKNTIAWMKASLPLAV